MIRAKFPTAFEVEKVYACLTRTPRHAAEIARDARMSFRKSCYALQALRFQRRAVSTCSGWMIRRHIS